MEKSTFKDKALRAASALGLVAVILIGAWGIIQIAFNLSGVLDNVGSWVGSAFNRQPAQTETITLALPELATAGEVLPVTWTHAGKSGSAYAYTIAYSCASGLSVKAPAPNGSLQDVPCNTPFNYTNGLTSMQLTPAVAAKKQATTTLTVSAIALDTGSVTVIDTKGITILPAQSATASTASTAAATRPALIGPTAAVVTTPYSNPNGRADLAATITSVVPQGAGSYSVQFVIKNVGDKVTPYGWVFEASLPYNGGNTYPYYSKAQRVLYPGEKIAYTLNLALPPTDTSINNYGCVPQYNQDNYQYQYQYQTYPYQYGYQYQTYQPQNIYQQQNCYTYTNYNSTVYQSGGTVQVVVDPQGVMADANRVNNTAIASVPPTNNAYNY